MKIIIDLDSTIISTGKTIIKVWNNLNPNKQLNDKIEPVWDFSNVLKDTDIELKELFIMFDKQEFYDNVIVFDNAINIINKLAESNEVIICSKHNESRKSLTTKWINENFKNVKIMYVNNFEDKKNIECDVIIDDKIDCLNGKAKLSICYGLYDWNENWNKVRCYNWKQVEQCIDFIAE